MEARGPKSEVALLDYMADCRDLVLDELGTFIPKDARLGPLLYDLMYEYPFRSAKALRPALCIATSRALGGPLHAVLRSATVIELYHNAFLIHDDVEDLSLMRRDGPTLHRQHGVPVAVNVGDAMLALALGPLLDNMRLIGMGKALRILQIISRMARESAEGQAIELAWARKVRWDLTDRDYLRMVHKKTGWYTFLTPILIGATVADARPEHLVHLRMFAISLGAAFQIQDDILNLVANEARYGKETAGDLWEGKHTLILLHAIRSASECDRRRAISVLGKQRPAISPENGANDVLSLVRELEHAGEVTPAAGKRISDRLLSLGDAARFKTSEDVEFLSDLIRQHRSVEHASRVAHKRALRAQRSLERVNAKLPPSVHLDFLHALVDFVVERDH